MAELPAKIWETIKDKEIFSFNIWFRILGILLYTDFYLSVFQSTQGFTINKYTDVLNLPFLLWYSIGIIIIIFLVSLSALLFYSLYANLYIKSCSSRNRIEQEVGITDMSEYAMKNNNAIIAEEVLKYKREKSDNFINTLTKIGVIIFFCFDMLWKNTYLYKTTSEDKPLQIIIIMICIPTICLFLQSLCVKESSDVLWIYSEKLRKSIREDLR